MRVHRTKKGFTLMEVLIVVAIIAVLVAIAIPTFKGSLDRAKEATCEANRRSLYGQVVSELMLSNRPCSELFDELAGKAGKCPSGGVFSWEDNERTGIINCSYHSGHGSSGSVPALHGTANITKLQRGTVLQDETGTCVILSGMWDTWTDYSGGKKVAALAAQHSADAVLVDASDIKDSSFTGTLETGDIYYDSVSDTFYYVTLVSLYESWPNSSWVPLLD